MIGRRAILLAGAAAGSGAISSGALAQRSGRAAAPVRRVTSTLGGAGSRFVLGCHDGAITSLRYRGDAFDTDYISAGAGLGRVRARFRRGAGAWTALNAADRAGAAEVRGEVDGVSLFSALQPDGAALVWSIVVANRGAAAVEIGDLALPMPMHTDFAGGRPVTESVMKHSFVSGHGSHVFWMRANSAGPYLLLLPDRDTALEYWQVSRDGARSWEAFVHAAAASAETAARGTRWRQPTTSLHLGPGEERRYGLRFVWVADYDAARAAIAHAGGVDVEIVPGMTLPTDLTAELALRSAEPIARIEAEFPAQTSIVPLGTRDGRQLYRIALARPGENRLTLHQRDGRRTHLEFFATEPVETMMRKRAAFIARRQHRDPTRWYDGLFGEWNMASQVLLGPDDYDRITGWRIYEVTCDDPGLSKPAYLASKNAEHPDRDEVAALDRYLHRFVWGGLQRTTAEPHPYGIYGIPDWKTNRQSKDRGPKGRDHIWRPYDYPHIMVAWFGMYRVARHHGTPTRHDAATYLRRAAGTAIAMFTVPMRVTGWSAYHTGFYNECVIPELIAALSAEGMTKDAATLEAHWARKVRAFVEPGADLFGSEYPFDSTGFESTQALARSALDRPAAMGVTRAQAGAFAQRQIAANLFCRGWLEPAYYYLGSDYRGSAGDGYTLSYMAQMGGWAVMDHALHDATDPHPAMRLASASQLSAWALLNSGPAAGGHGYWYPGEANDGGAGGGFEPAPEGETWLDQPHHRGSWYYSCEIDLGFCGAVRAARTIVADDPVFGRTAYGTEWREEGGAIVLIPRDGVRRRLSARLATGGFDVTLVDARFAAERPVTIARGARSLSFAVEPFVAGAGFVAVEWRAGGAWRRQRVAIVEGLATVALV